MMLLGDVSNLASVLSDTKRSKAEVAAFFTRHWGEQFVPQKTLPSASTIPKICLEHFRHYLDNTAKKHRQYLRVRKTLRRANAQLFGEQISSDEIPGIFFSAAFSHRDPATFEAIFLEPRQGEADKLVSGPEQRRVAGVQQSSLCRPASCGSLSSMQSVQVITSPAEASQGRMFRCCQRLQIRLEHFDDAVGILLNQQLEAKNEHFCCLSVVDLSEQKKKEKKNGCCGWDGFTQNLASVLSDTKRSKAEVAAFFTRHWGEQFVPQKTLPSASTIPKICLEHFRHYLDNTAKKHRQYLRVRKTLRRANAQLFGEQISSDEIPGIFFSAAFSHREPATFEAIFLEPRQGEADKLVSGPEQRRVAGVQQSSLCRPASCGSLSSMQSVQVITSPAEASQGRMFRCCQRLQNRLEHFDDAVGILLNQQLEAKNEHFWRIINSYGALQADLETAIERTLRARDRLSKSKRQLCERSERILSLHQAKLNRQRVLGRLKEIACLRDAQMTVQILLSQGDISRALECIDMAKEVLANDLLGVNCFRHLGSQLDELVVAIGKVLREEFLSIIQREFAWPIEERTAEGRKQREEEMSRVISSLIRCGEFRFVLMLRGEVEEAVKNTTRQVVKSRLLEHVQNNSAVAVSPFSEQIGLLPEEHWEKTLLAVLHSLTLLCRSVLAIQSLVVLCADQFDDNGSVGASKKLSSRGRSATDVFNLEKLPRRRDSFCTSASAPQQAVLMEDADPNLDELTRETNSDCGPEALDGLGREGEDGRGTAEGGQGKAQRIAKGPEAENGPVLAMPCHDIFQLRTAAPLLISHAIQTGEDRVAKLILARYKDAILERCRPAIFHKMCKTVTDSVESWHKMAAEGGRCSKGPSPDGGNGTHRSPVHTIIHQQTTKFIHKFSETKRRQFHEAIDTEPWQPATIPSVYQRIVDRFRLSGVLSDVDDVPTEEDEDDDREGNRDYLVLCGGKQFIVVGTATLLLRILAQYSDLLVLFAHCAMELTMDVVQMLKAFNSRTCQLILGAGARQLVGLKMISVKHLTLALRSLQFIAQFIPTLRQSFSNELPTDRHTLLRHFDQTQRDFEDHAREIRSKMLGLMDRELIGALEEWRLEGKTPTASFQQIVMQIGKFYSSYSAIMPPELTTEILLQIHMNFKLYLRQHLNSRAFRPRFDCLRNGGSGLCLLLENVRALPDCKSFPVDTIGDVIQHKQPS
uniref:Vacuolar protein sorting-associated protein 54 n=1 Tax=Globodera pallida TaxID=36090 RepID=A0A183BJU3_GLOPA